mgnify:CR=1 FL=1
MKVDRLETHDRYKHFIQDQQHTIWKGADDCLKINSDSLKIQEKCHYVYLFAQPRTAEDGYKKRLLWQPRLLKPKAQTNSYLFRAQSNTDIIEICWLIPPREMWNQYDKGKVCESNWTSWSIWQFQNNRAELEKPFADDVTDEQAKNIFKKILQEGIEAKQAALAVSSSVFE